MSKMQFSVYEFMAIMGRIDEDLTAAKHPDGSVFLEWEDQWRQMEKKLDSLAPMERADLLFDGKVTINAISEAHLRQVVDVVASQVKMQEDLHEDNDPDADEEDLAMWRTRLRDLSGILASFVAGD
jgi:hypothetical protein